MQDQKIDFIGFGTTKSASTWIFKCLGEHPEICKSSIKETRFFDNSFNYKKGLGWYLSLFKNYSPGKLRGEFSPTYILSMDAAKRIHDNFPDVKLISVFRNPVDKVYSYYWANKNGGRGTLITFKTFEEAIERVPDILKEALHGAQLREYMKVFKKEQFHFILYDELMANPQKVMKDLYNFLGVDESFMAPSVGSRVNATGDKILTYPLLFKIVYFINWQTKKSPWLTRQIRKLNTLAISDFLVKLGRRKGGSQMEKPKMNEDTRKKIKNFFSEDVRLLEELTGKDLSEWK